ncbi:hypothetical protein EVAR_4942_1 [Eumeta japonica]|uniref:Uncharacterized protein n=1 Tax=Eumeta variegata TaxID=151549 RepID=A0A4C1V0B9_EUMVA|nr:hypothetical protein EVAR_4942_1 [Eumeta japonica]
MSNTDDLTCCKKHGTCGLICILTNPPPPAGFKLGTFCFENLLRPRPHDHRRRRATHVRSCHPTASAPRTVHGRYTADKSVRVPQPTRDPLSFILFICVPATKGESLLPASAALFKIHNKKSNGIRL